MLSILKDDKQQLDNLLRLARERAADPALKDHIRAAYANLKDRVGAAVSEFELDTFGYSKAGTTVTQ